MDNGLKIKCVAQGHITTVMVLFIKDSGKIINIVVKVFTSSQMVLSIKENGKEIKCMAQDFLLIIQEENGEDNLETENFKVNSRLSLSNKKLLL